MSTPSTPSTPSNAHTSHNRRRDKKQNDPNLKLYAIYPDYWPEKWGDKPLLGHVRAYEPFYAVRKAYDHGLVRVNFTFSVKAIEVKHVRERPQA